MIMKIVFLDGSWIIGDRKWYFMRETPGTHHYIALDFSKEFDESIRGKWIAITIPNVRYFILDYKNSHNDKVEMK